jgi:hypothetical protein
MKSVPNYRPHQPCNLTQRGVHLGAAIVGCLSAIASSAHAHPGHSLKDATAAHIVSSPYHLAALAGAGLLIFGASWCIQRQRPRRGMQFAGLVAMGAALLLWGTRS